MSNRQLHASDVYAGETYPVLPGIAYAIRWIDGFTSLLEQLIMSLSGIFLTVGISFSMLDFLTGGQLLQNEYVFYSWAWIQTVAIDSQFVSMWYRSKLAFKRGQVLQGLGYIFLGGILAFVTFGAAAIPSLQSALHIKFNDALSLLYLNPVLLVYARSVVVIVLAVIGAYTRAVLHFDKSGARLEIVEDGENISVMTETKNVADDGAKIVEEQDKKSRKKWQLFGKKNDKNLSASDEKSSSENGKKRWKLFAKKSDKNLSENDEDFSSDEAQNLAKNFVMTETKNVEKNSDNFSAPDAKNYPLQDDKNLLEMAQNFSAPDAENFAPSGAVPATPGCEIFVEKKQDTGDNLNAADIAAAISSAQVPVQQEQQEAETDSNLLAMRDDAAFQLAQDNDSAVSRYNAILTAENTSSMEDTTGCKSDGASRVPVAKREQIKLSKQDVLSHPKVVQFFPDLRSRRRAVDAAWNNEISVKSDGFARENAVNTWIKSLSAEKQTAKQA